MSVTYPRGEEREEDLEDNAGEEAGEGWESEIMVRLRRFGRTVRVR